MEQRKQRKPVSKLASGTKDGYEKKRQQTFRQKFSGKRKGRIKMCLLVTCIVASFLGLLLTTRNSSFLEKQQKMLDELTLDNLPNSLYSGQNSLTIRMHGFQERQESNQESGDNRTQLLQNPQTFTGFSATNSLSAPPWCRMPQTLSSLKNPNFRRAPREGLFLAKTFKTASSTAATVTMQLARRVAHRHYPTNNKTDEPKACLYAFAHELSLANAFASRGPNSFLWTTIRNPVERARSAYNYYITSLLGIPPSKESLIKYLEATKDQMLQQVQLSRPPIRETMGILQPQTTLRNNRWDNRRDNRRNGQDKQPRQTPLLERVKSGPKTVKIIRDTVAGYNLIAISKRWEECMILLLVLLGLLDPQSNNGDSVDAILSDAVVLSSKRAAGRTAFGENWVLELPPGGIQKRVQRIQSIVSLDQVNTSKASCIPLNGGKDKEKQLTLLWNDPAVQDYLQHNYSIDNLDFLFYDHVNNSLDSTIAKLVGHETMNRLVLRFRALQTEAQHTCLSEAVFPCSKEGKRAPSSSRAQCYVRDMGCGHHCLDRLFYR